MLTKQNIVIITCNYFSLVRNDNFGKFSGRRNRQTRPRRFWVHDVLRRRDDLGEYARLVQELTLDSARSHGYFRMSTEQVGYVLGLVGPYISRLPTVRGSSRAGTHDVVRSVNVALDAALKAISSNTLIVFAEWKICMN